MLMGEWSSVLRGVLNGNLGKSGEHLKVLQYTGLDDKTARRFMRGMLLSLRNLEWKAMYKMRSQVLRGRLCCRMG